LFNIFVLKNVVSPFLSFCTFWVYGHLQLTHRKVTPRIKREKKEKRDERESVREEREREGDRK
jgi:hypothetical protein